VVAAIRPASRLLLVSALCTLAAACGSGSSASTDLTIRLSRGEDGNRTYSLHCPAADGSAPRPEAACAAIAKDASLLTSHPGVGHSCPYGPPLVDVDGASHGRKVSAQFSVCVTGQERSAVRWIELLGYGPLWVRRPGAATGVPVSIRVDLPSAISRTFPYGVVTDVVVSPQRRVGAAVYSARTYYGFFGGMTTHLPPGEWLIRSDVQPCIDNCDRPGRPRRACVLPFTARAGEPVRLDVRFDPKGACRVQIEQHG
jgi:hypothetical protein